MPVSFESSNKRCKLWTEFVRFFCILKYITVIVSLSPVWKRSTVMSIAYLPVSHVCMHLFGSVCLFVCLSQGPHDQTSCHFICMLPMTIIQSYFLWRRCDIHYGWLDNVPCMHTARKRRCEKYIPCISTKTDSTGNSSRPWVESDVCRLTAKCNNILSKAYLNSLQGNKNGQICAPSALLKDKMFSASVTMQGLCPWTPLGAPHPEPRYRLALSARYAPPPLLWWSLRQWQ